MGVKYDVIFKDGRRLSREAVCFGSMAGASWSLSGPQELNHIDPANQAMIQFHSANNLHPIWSEPDFTRTRREWENSNRQGEARRNANRAYLAEMAELIKDLPWLQDVITVHPLVGVVRAHLKTHKADKVITSLFLMRNLGNYGNMAASYRHFRHMGIRPRVCAIMAHIVAKDFGAMNRVNFSQQYLGEYNWINPQTFGKNSFMRMMLADKDEEFSFLQLPWTTQRGYRRDGFFRWCPNMDNSASAHEDEFSLEEGGWKVFDTRYVNAADYSNGRVVDERRTTRNNCSYLLTHNLVDCYSIPGDEPIAEPQTWNPVHGMTLLRNTPADENNQRVNSLLEQMEALCNEAGIPFRDQEQN